MAKHKNGKKFVKQAKKFLSGAYESVKEDVGSLFESPEPPSMAEQKAMLEGQKIALERVKIAREIAQLRQQQGLPQPMSKAERFAVKTREFSRGAEAKLEEAVGLRKSIAKTTLIKQKSIRMYPRRRVSSFLSSNALRI